MGDSDSPPKVSEAHIVSEGRVGVPELEMPRASLRAFISCPEVSLNDPRLADPLLLPEVGGRKSGINAE